jgi:hypothetical protein
VASAGAYAVVGFLGITGALDSTREADSLRHAYAVFGSVILIIGVTSGGDFKCGSENTRTAATAKKSDLETTD